MSDIKAIQPRDFGQRFRHFIRKVKPAGFINLSLIGLFFATSTVFAG